MKKEFENIVDYVTDGIIRGAFDLADCKRFVENKLMDIMSESVRDEQNNELLEVREQIYDAVKNDWKVKAHDKNIEVIRSLEFEYVEYDSYYANAYK